MIKILAIAVALVLSLGVISGVYAQNATSLQIQIVPEIQRGHQQHLTIFAVDDTGNQVNGSGEIVSSVENAKGKLVGPKTVYTESGEDVSYKVGPNTSPQNITVSSCLADSELCAEQNYYVYPKGQAQQPVPPTPEYPAPIPIPTEEPTPEVPVTNDTEDGEIVIPANETEVTTPENQTDVTINDTGEAEPLPPITNETVPVEGNVTIPVTNETTEPVPFPPQNETQVPPGTVNETIPIEGNVTIPIGNETTPVIPPIINETQGNVTIPEPEVPAIVNETQNATVEPEPLPPANGGNGGNETGPIIDEGGAGGTPNGTIPAEPEGTTPVNASEAFTQLENTTAVLDQKLDEVTDNSNETNRGELKALAGEVSNSFVDSEAFVSATNEQLQIVQNSAISLSESIDELLVADTEQADEQAEAEGDAEGEDEQGENEQ